MHAGHVVFKKILLEISWQLVRYLHKIGAVEGDDRAYLMYAPNLVYLTMAGRMMQATSDSVELAVALELFAIIAEVFEARDLLRSDTPLKKNKETVRYIGRQLSRSGSSRIDVTEGNGDSEGPGASKAGQAVDTEAEEFDDTDLHREFCARVLITTQLAEAVSIFVATALVVAMPPISFGQVGTPPISDGVLWGNFAVMLIGEAILSDALVTYLSRSGWMQGVKVDLPVRAAQTPACLRCAIDSKAAQITYRDSNPSLTLPLAP